MMLTMMVIMSVMMTQPYSKAKFWLKYNQSYWFIVLDVLAAVTSVKYTNGKP